MGCFGTGDLGIFAGGDVQGRFLVKNGKAVINAMGNFGSPVAPELQVIEAFSGKINISAGGNIDLGDVVNPTVANSTLSPAVGNPGTSSTDRIRMSALRP